MIAALKQISGLMRAACWAGRRASPLGTTLPAAAAGACGVMCDKSGGRGEFAVCRRVRATKGRGREEGRVRSYTRAERKRHNAGTWDGATAWHTCEACRPLPAASVAGKQGWQAGRQAPGLLWAM